MGNENKIFGLMFAAAVLLMAVVIWAVANDHSNTHCGTQVNAQVPGMAAPPAVTLDCSRH